MPSASRRACAIACIETGDRERCDPPAGFELLDERKHGRARGTFLRFVAAATS